MYFTVIPANETSPREAVSAAFLVEDNWDDWFKYSTMYTLFVFDEHGEKHRVGSVKIGQFDMKEKQRRSEIPQRFDELDDRFFSLGQDDSYYATLNDLGSEVRERILRGLRDIALDLSLFDRSISEKVTGNSLLRSVLRNNVTGQFHRMAQGGARLTRYKFGYKRAGRRRSRRSMSIDLNFSVQPESYPPSNIHVLIGRNGVGKTVTLNNMANAIVEENGNASEFGTFYVDNDETSTEQLFANLVSVTFSAFDPFEPLSSRQDKSTGVQYAYVGLKYVGRGKDGKPRPPKSPEQLSRDFSASIAVCRQGARAQRWHRALKVLEGDPIFRDAEVATLASDDLDSDQRKETASKLFSRLSSGHKIVLLTITRLIETVGEKTLVLMDEPEAHLHPPLLSAFIRAFSDLLIDRNGVAVIATHSPVVLQEVPRSCVWKIRRMGMRVVAERPEIETFGENVGVLTREVFGLEVTHSGFHKMLLESLEEEEDFDDVVAKYSSELGGEARALLRGLIASRGDVEEQDG